jgi:hypothetical protein
MVDSYQYENNLYNNAMLAVLTMINGHLYKEVLRLTIGEEKENVEKWNKYNEGILNDINRCVDDLISVSYEVIDSSNEMSSETKEMVRRINDKVVSNVKNMFKWYFKD